MSEWAFVRKPRGIPEIGNKGKGSKWHGEPMTVKWRNVSPGRKFISWLQGKFGCHEKALSVSL